MQTNFTPAQLADPAIARSNGILRACVHCGFCTATCPTYQVLGDELDSPRGRIYLIKDMLESGRPADAETALHIDRCLSCLACMTTCPSGVHYMHLVDHARDHIERTYRRPLPDRAMRWLLANVLPYPKRFRFAVLGAWIATPFAWLLPARLANLVRFAPRSVPPVSRLDDAQVIPAEGARLRRVALLTGCAQKALNTDINAATIRLLTRHGCEVVIVQDVGCCGSLTHHMGRRDQTLALASANVRAFAREIDAGGLDAIVVNTSGCGTTMKDYATMFEGEALAEDAARVAALTRDVSEVLADLDLRPGRAEPLRVTYHAACSLQHGQGIRDLPKTLLSRAGFEIVEPRDPHLCCGSAGTYNLLQPEIAEKLRARKVATIEETAPEAIATGNIGCMMQIGAGIDVPVLHTVELLDWASGGPLPAALRTGPQ